MADVYLGCSDGAFQQTNTLSGPQIHCTGTLDNVPASEFAELVAETTFLQLMADIFSTPTTPEIQTAFMAGFSIPMITYLAAWGYGVVIRFASRDRD